MNVALIGAGSRGFHLSRLLQEQAPWMKITAVAEPRDKARAQTVAEFKIPPENVFESWQLMMAKAPDCQAAIIATMDKDHRGPAEAAMAKGWHLILEKPMAPNWEDCAAIESAQANSGVTVAVCHSLRYHLAFQKAREIAKSGVLGNLMTIDLMEQVGYWHFAHSFVRGNWRREDESAFVLLAKSCHDMDFLSFLADRPCLSVSSFGQLSHFKAENAPAGALQRCEGCPVSACPYDARKLYRPESPAWGFVKTRSETLGETLEQARDAMLAGPLGRCVYHCDNDVADHQVVSMEFEGGLAVNFTLSAFTVDCARKLRIQGTMGEMEMREEKEGHRFIVKKFGGTVKEELLPWEEGSHGGADARLVAAWAQSLKSGDKSKVISSVQASLASHRIAFAAEASRIQKKVISISDFGKVLA